MQTAFVQHLLSSVCLPAHLDMKVFVDADSDGSSGTFPSVDAASSSRTSLGNRRSSGTWSPLCSQLTSWCREASVLLLVLLGILFPSRVRLHV